MGSMWTAVGMRRHRLLKYRHVWTAACGRHVDIGVGADGGCWIMDHGSERLGATAGPPAISSTGVARSGAGGANPARAVVHSTPVRIQYTSGRITAGRRMSHSLKGGHLTGPLGS